MIYTHKKILDDDGHWDGEIRCCKTTDDGELKDMTSAWVDEQGRCDVCENSIEGEIEAENNEKEITYEKNHS